MTIASALRVGFQGLRAAVASRIREATMRQQIAQEFKSLGGRDLDRVLADIGCSRDELDTLVYNAPRSRPLLDAMILRLGLEKAFAFAAPSLMRDIERRCAICPTQPICSRWLSKGGAAGEYRAFCPNVGNFDLLAGERRA